MKKFKKKLSVIIMIIIITVCTINVLSIESYAENTISDNNTTENKEEIDKSEDEVDEEKVAEEERKKAKDNATLSILGIRPHDFTGFKYGKFSYEATVPENVEKIEVYASTQNPNAKVEGTGSKTLEIGENKLDVVVTSEDGSVEKTYTINVTREGTEEKTEDKEEVEDDEQQTEVIEETDNSEKAKGLVNLEIVSAELSPIFETDIYEYTVNYVGDNVKMNIQAKATDDSYNIEIVGNENLKEGENLINILVTDENGNNVATYQITINKSLESKEDIQQKEQEVVKKEEQKKQIILWTAVGVASIIVIVIIIVVRNRNKRFAEEYSIPYANINNKFDDEEDYNYEVKSKEINDSKEKAKKEYLENFGTNNYDYDEKDEVVKEKKSRKRHKGKRFK